MSEWHQATIAELCARTTSGGTPSRKKLEFFCDPPEGVPWVKSQELTDRRIRACSEHITESGLKGSSAKLVPAGSVLVAMYGATVGQLGYLDIEATTNQAVCALITDPNITDSRFLYYALMHARSDLIAQAQGAAQQNLSQAVIRQFSLRVPSLARQREVGSLLTAIDDLIENNRRRVDVLDEMARAIYREWFVHFRYPGHEHATFVESSLGLIPEGWEVGTVSDLCTRIQAGSTPKRSDSSFWVDGEVDWYKTGDLTDSVLVHSSEKISNRAIQASTARIFQPGTILIAIYGSPTVGRLGLVEKASSANQAALGLVADPTRSSVVYLWFLLEGLRAHLNQIAQGAAQQNVSKAKVASAPALIPPPDVVSTFTSRVEPAWRLCHRLVRQTHTLASLRDAVLPKLVTGQIDVSSLDLDSLLVTVV
jgi:type I restriction enzyme S subunit